MDWQEEYRKKSCSPAEAVATVKSGDRVAIPLMEEPVALMEALFARKDELADVEVLVGAPTVDPGWFQPGCERAFKINVELFVQPVVRAMIDEKRADFTPFPQGLRFKNEREGREQACHVDVLLVTVSPPDKNGYCSFGIGPWHKKAYARYSRKVLAEVDDGMVRTHGDNYIHVSEIGCFAPHKPNPKRGKGRPPQFGEVLRGIASNVAALIRDGDTVEMGIGPYSRYLPSLGIFDGRNDLGLHTEILYPETVQAIRNGVITGKRKSLHREKAVASAAWIFEREEEAFLADNPQVELREMEYVCNITVIAAHDNMVSINSALAVDFSGQVAAEGIGPQVWTGAGGQTEFAIGAVLSKGGRSITVLPSRAAGGHLSRIVPTLEPGTVVTVPRLFVDHVVTEYGVARLFGKSYRQRAEELIAIAHPDFREELRTEARRLLYP